MVCHDKPHGERSCPTSFVNFARNCLSQCLWIALRATVVCFAGAIRCYGEEAFTSPSQLTFRVIGFRSTLIVTRTPLLGAVSTSKSVLVVFAQRLNDKRPDLSGDRPHHVLRQSRSIVGDDHAIAVLTLAQTFDRDDTISPATERMLERVGQKLVYD